MLCYQLVVDDGNERDDLDNRERGNGVRRKPIFFLSLVEHELQRANADCQHPKAPIIDSSRLPAEVRRIEYKELRHHNRSDADWNVDVEDPPPAVVVREPAAEDRSENRRDDDALPPEA